MCVANALISPRVADEVALVNVFCALSFSSAEPTLLMKRAIAML